MPDNRLEIIISAVDEASDKIKAVASEIQRCTGIVQDSMQNASKSMVAFGNEMRMVGRTISNTGMTMSFFGASITAPFIIALKNSAKNSWELSQRLENLKANFEELQATIAKAVIPIVDRLSNAFSQFNTFLNTLTPEIKNNILQTTMLTGIYLTFSGILLMVIGRVWTLGGNLFRLSGMFLGFATAHIPLMAISIAITAIVVAMWKWKAVADTIMSTFQVLFLLIKNGFDSIIIAVEGAVLGMMTPIGWLYNAMAQIPGPMQSMFRGAADNIRGVTDTLRNSIQISTADIQNNVNTIGGIFQTGTGTWSKSFDKFKEKVEDVIHVVKNVGTTATETTKTSAEAQKKMVADTVSALDTLNGALQGAKSLGRGFFIAAQAMAISMAIIHTAVGAMKAWADYGWPLGAVIAGIIVAAGAIQIATIAAQKFASGGRPPVGVPSIIGERGPELWVPDQAGTIIPNNRLGNMGNQTSIYIEINNPTVRSDEDIDKLTEEVSNRISREVQRL